MLFIYLQISVNSAYIAAVWQCELILFALSIICIILSVGLEMCARQQICWNKQNLFPAVLTLFKVAATYLPKKIFSLLGSDTSIATLLNAL